MKAWNPFDLESVISNTNGGAGSVTVDLTPPLGCRYLIQAAVGDHNHAGAVNCQWVLIRAPIPTILLLDAVQAITTGVMSSLYNRCNFAHPLILRYGDTLRYSALVGAGELVTIHAVYLKLSGEEAYP